MATSKVEYLGNLSTKCTHVKSGVEIITDAPIDNKGKGASFSPTDLMATSYASCLITIIGIYCQEHAIEFNFCNAEVTKIMGSAPRRIAELQIDLDFTQNNWSDAIQKRVKRAGETCPVAKSVNSEMKIEFVYHF
ncbi:MAG TPA: OsmC family peroxiredoxin [Crocinitomicaceae bacterium]|nr:OsmC family peroxiredoxin [Crocinitomicaceae bacterium]